MAQLEKPQSFAGEGRIAVSMQLPRAFHRRMREIAFRQEIRVNDLYQSILESYIEGGRARSILLAPPSNGQKVTLWFSPEFMAKFRSTVRMNHWTPASLVFTAALDQLGEHELLVAA